MAKSKKSGGTKPKSTDYLNGKFHQAARKVLENKLSNELKDLTLREGFVYQYPDGFGWEFAEEVAKHRKAHLNKIQAWSALFDQINGFFADLPVEDRPTGKLTSEVKQADQDELVKRIIDYFESMPRKYSVYFVLQRSKKVAMPDVNIAPGIDLLNVSKANGLLSIKGRLGFPTMMELLGAENGNSSVFKDGDIVLKFQSAGFADTNTDSRAIASSLSNLKTLLYLGKGLGVFRQEKDWSPWGGVLDCHLYVVDETSGKNLARELSITDESKRFLSTFSLMPKSENEPEVKYDFRLHQLDIIGKLLGAEVTDINRAPIVAAAEWAFESAGSSNQTVAFLQLCIALEAILGDEAASEGLTKTLSDRCAYLLGYTVETRSKIRESFSELYKHRSKLVHGRRVNLDDDASRSLHWGRRVLDAILKKELRNFERSQN
jgi:hypothetical protein